MAIRGTNIFTLLEDSGDEEEPKETVVKTAAPVVDLREEKKPKPAETNAKPVETSAKPAETKAKPVEAKPKPAEGKREEVKKEAVSEEVKPAPKAEIVEVKKQTKPQEVTAPEQTTASNPEPAPVESVPSKKVPRKKPETEEERRTQREEQWQKKREEEREAEDRARAEASRYMTYQELLRSKEQEGNSDEPTAEERKAKEKTGFLLPSQVRNDHFSRGGRGSRGRGRGGFRPTNQPEKPSAAPPKFDSADFPALSS